MSEGGSSRHRRVLVVCANLFFTARIEETGRTVGARVEIVPILDAPQACRLSPVDLLLVDLEAPDDPIGLIRRLAADGGARPRSIVAFYAHVRDELRRAALEAGADRVLPRSAFTKRLPDLMAGGHGS